MSDTIELADDRPSEVRLSPNGDLLYSADADGNVRVYNTATGALVTTWDIGQNLGGMDISPDGSFLVIVERNLSTTYKVDTTTGAKTNYNYATSGYDGLLFDVAVLSDGTALFSQNFNGSGWVSLKVLDFGTGVYTAGPSVRQSSVLSRSPTGETVFIGEPNTSGGTIDIYQTGVGIVETSGAGGFNWGIQAYNGDLAAHYIYNEGIHVYDADLDRQITLTAWNNGKVTDLAFSADSAWLYVLDNDANLIHKISTSDWETEASYPVDADVGSWMGQIGATRGGRLLLDPQGRFLSVITDGELVLVTTVEPTYGTEGDDNLSGTDGNDEIYALGGNDTVSAGAGDDKVDGGAGNDTLNGGDGNDALNGGAGNDILHGDGGDDVLIAGTDGYDLHYGDAGNDEFRIINDAATSLFAAGIFDGGTGYDVLVVGGIAEMNNGVGSEELHLMPVEEGSSRPATELTISASNLRGPGAGGALLVTGAGSITVNVGINENGSNIVFGEGASIAFTYNGSTGTETIIGTSGGDLIFGFEGNDTLEGGLGNDTIDGGAGIDKAIFGSRLGARIVHGTDGVVTVTSTHGADTFTNVEQFHFSDTGKHAFTAATSWTPATAGDEGWTVGDFNGDGKADLLRYLPGVTGADVQLSDGSGFNQSGSWTGAGNGDEGWYVGDFNGDGKDDVFRYVAGQSGADMFLSSGSSFAYSGSWSPAGNGDAGWHVGDFNGDGRDDVFRYVEGVSGAQMFLSNGSGFDFAGSWTPAGNGDAGWHVGDFNGDGRDDVFRYIDGVSGAEMFLSNGSGFDFAGNWTGAGSGDEGWHVGDFNGDGLDDIFRVLADETGAQVFKSTGGGFNIFANFTGAGSGEDGWYVADFDGDITADLMRAMPTGAEVLL